MKISNRSDINKFLEKILNIDRGYDTFKYFFPLPLKFMNFMKIDESKMINKSLGKMHFLKNVLEGKNYKSL